MSKKDFNELVKIAMNRPGLMALKPVVEKEILHYDILFALDKEGLLKDIVFQGGTSLRLCRGSDRYSEDLDFAGGKKFNKEKMTKIKNCLETHIGQRYGLTVQVKEPKSNSEKIDNVRVDKWVVSVETFPGNRIIPRQKIKLEIANVPAYTRELVPIRFNYNFLEGTGRVLVPTETLSEILADKLLAFPSSLLNQKGEVAELSSKRIRHRDIWDIAWLMEKKAVLNQELVTKKIEDYGIPDYFVRLDNAISMLPEIISSKEFHEQMLRFLDFETYNRTLKQTDYLEYLSNSLKTIFEEILSGPVKKLS